jgi:hypothetical protein
VKLKRTDVKVVEREEWDQLEKSLQAVKESGFYPVSYAKPFEEVTSRKDLV